MPGRTAMLDAMMGVRVGLVMAIAAVVAVPAVEHGFDARLDLRHIAAADLDNPAVEDGGELRQRSLAGELRWRVTFAQREIEGAPRALPLVWWEHGVSYQRLAIDYELDPATDPIEDFTAIGYRSLFSHRFHRNWSYTVIAGADVAVDDVGEAGGDDLQFSGGVQVAWHSGRENAVGIGLFYQQLLGESRVLPFPFLRWASAERHHRVSLMGPRLDYRYGLTQAHSLGAFLQLSGDRLLILSQRFRDHDAGGRLVTADEEAALAVTQLILGCRYGYRRDRRWDVAAEAGWVFARSFELVTRDGGDPIRLGDGTEVDFEPDASWSVRLSAGCRF